MGADLIVYMLVGPPQALPTEKKQEMMLDRANRMVKAARKATTYEDGSRDPGSGYCDLTKLTTAEQRVLEGLDDPDNDMEYLSGLEPEKVLTEFFHLWNRSGYRDCATRLFKAGRKEYHIHVAGEMSWGDEPDGAGYQTIKAALMLKFPWKMGIH